MADCFVIMPITTPAEVVERYNGDADHFVHVLEHLIAPAVEQAGYTAVRPSASGSDLIHAEIIKNLENADLVLCDISTLNANVFFELGIRTALNRPICLIRDEHVRTLPFDTGVLNFHRYDSSIAPWVLDAQIEALAEHVRASADRSNGRNALWNFFGLTQPGVPARDTIGADPREEKLDVLLAEVQRLRADAQARGGEGAADDEPSPLRRFWAETGPALRAAKIGFAKMSRRGDRVTIVVNQQPDSELAARIRAAAQASGLEVEFKLE